MLPDSGEEITIDKKEIIVGDFIKRFGETGEVRELDAAVLRAVLEAHGANFDNLDGQGYLSLSGYSNKIKHLGMEQVWGANRGKFRKWCEEWVSEYEKTHDSLKAVKFTGRPSKTEGMRQFLGQLTSYAGGRLEFDDLKEDFEKRYRNFGKPKGQGERLLIPGYNISEKTGEEKPFAPASFPPEFPISAWAEIVSWKK